MFQKKKKTKKKREHKPSILQVKDGSCYLCMMEGNYRKYAIVHKHHIFSGTANRTISEAEGFICYLCPDHHEFSSAAVHRNAENMIRLRRIAQREYEKTHTREEFMDLIGRNYLQEDEE